MRPKDSSPQADSEANRRMLALLQAWQAEPLTAAEKDLLDDFDAFQARYPLRLTHSAEEP